MEAYGDLRYSIGTFSMGGYGYAAAGVVNGEMRGWPGFARLL